MAPDLEDVAAHNGLSVEDVIRIHARQEYLVYFLGFSPGFPYLGDLPTELATPRLKTPRLRVLTGSVAIGGSQTGIYPVDSPGGWRLIGRTPLSLFSPEKDPPTLLRMGDRVHFVPITMKEFDALRKRRVAHAAHARSETRVSDNGPGPRTVRLRPPRDLGIGSGRPRFPPHREPDPRQRSFRARPRNDPGGRRVPVRRSGPRRHDRLRTSYPRSTRLPFRSGARSRSAPARSCASGPPPTEPAVISASAADSRSRRSSGVPRLTS